MGPLAIPALLAQSLTELQIEAKGMIGQRLQLQLLFFGDHTFCLIVLVVLNMRGRPEDEGGTAWFSYDFEQSQRQIQDVLEMYTEDRYPLFFL